MPVTFLARKVFDDGGSAATGAAVADALRGELEALAEASTRLRFLMLRVLDVALRHLATFVAGDDWAGAMPIYLQPVWLWLAYACGFTGVTGSPLPSSVARGVCGNARTNTRHAPAHAQLAERYPQLMSSLRYGLEQVLSVASPACDRYLPKGNNAARWVPVATVFTTHVERSVQAAFLKLGAKATDAVLNAAPASACWAPRTPTISGSWRGWQRRASAPAPPAKPRAGDASRACSTPCWTRWQER